MAAVTAPMWIALPSASVAKASVSLKGCVSSRDALYPGTLIGRFSVGFVPPASKDSYGASSSLRDGGAPPLGGWRKLASPIHPAHHHPVNRPRYRGVEPAVAAVAAPCPVPFVHYGHLGPLRPLRLVGRQAVAVFELRGIEAVLRMDLLATERLGMHHDAAHHFIAFPGEEVGDEEIIVLVMRLARLHRPHAAVEQFAIVVRQRAPADELLPGQRDFPMVAEDAAYHPVVPTPRLV